MVCEACGGTGQCGPCDGYGTWDFPIAGEIVDCEACDGDGTCTDCGGTGEIDADPSDIEFETGVGD
jgi:hypothetical protein